MFNIEEMWISICRNVTQNNNGSFPNGNNGPHGDKETPVRTTSHILYMLCKLIELGHTEFIDKANMSVDYLIGHRARPMGASFWCRENPSKDFCNGLVGQAWVMESLLYAHKVLNRDDCYDTVNDVLNKHHWNNNLSAWHTLNVDGSNGPICVTFNQQLWFAMISLSMGGNSSHYDKGISFIDNILPQLELYQDGVIYHDTPASNIGKERTIRNRLKKLIKLIKIKNRMKDKRARSVGYHSFNLVALKKIKIILPDHVFWKSNLFKKLCEAIKNEQYKTETRSNKFSYPYNPVGFENAYFLQDSDLKLAKEYYLEQIKYINCDGQRITINESYDPINSIARLYESCRLADEITGRIN